MIFSHQPVKPGPRWGLPASFAGHMVAFTFLLAVPALRLPRPAENPSEFRLKFEGHEDKIVYYKLRKELPQVNPVRPKPSEPRPLKAENKAAQEIISAPPKPLKQTQMTWTPAPEIAVKPVEAPNLIAVKLPPRTFAAPEVRKAVPAERNLVAAEAPRLDAAPAPAVDLNAPKLPPKRFAAPSLAKAAPVERSITVADAPRLNAAPAPAIDLNAPKLPPKMFAAPSLAKAAPVERNIAVADAPGIAPAAASTADWNADINAPKLPPKPFAAPATTRTATKGIDTSAAADAEAAIGANIAIVGLNPIDKLASLPSASSPAAFSAGPVVRKEGATSEGTERGVAVPDLFVRGKLPPKKPDLYAMAHAAPTAEATLRAAAGKGETAGAPPPSAAAASPGVTRVSNAPDPRFNGREVFMMAIQMPQITSYSGSWLMWYAARTAQEAALAPIAPPVAHRKVDPKYIASAVSERIEGRVTLGCVIETDGRVSGVELLRGIDERLNQSAREALSKWEFFPASRNGQPVAVDVVVEIPFRLEPVIPRR